MGIQVVAGATMQCTFGASPAVLGVLPTKRTTAGGPPTAVITDHIPMVNIPTFGLCSSLANPTVAAATSAAMGVLTPMPCIPNTVTPWAPGSPTCLIGNTPALNNNSKCACMWAGVVSIVMPGQTTTLIP